MRIIFRGLKAQNNTKSFEACFFLSHSLLDHFFCVVLLPFIIQSKKYMKNRWHYCYLLFAIHFHLSDNFRKWEILLHFARIIFRGKCQNLQKPRNIIRAKINPLKVSCIIVCYRVLSPIFAGDKKRISFTILSSTLRLQIKNI